MGIVDEVAAKSQVDPSNIQLFHRGRRVNPTETVAQAKLTDSKLLFVYNYKQRPKFDRNMMGPTLDLSEGDRVVTCRVTTEDGTPAEHWGLVRTTEGVTKGVRTWEVHIRNACETEKLRGTSLI